MSDRSGERRVLLCLLGGALVLTGAVSAGVVLSGSATAATPAATASVDVTVSDPRTGERVTKAVPGQELAVRCDYQGFGDTRWDVGVDQVVFPLNQSRESTRRRTVDGNGSVTFRLTAPTFGPFTWLHLSCQARSGGALGGLVGTRVNDSTTVGWTGTNVYATMPEPTVRETESVSVSYHGWTTRTTQPLSLRVEGDVVDDRAVSPGTGTGFTGTFDPFTPADHVETERDRTLSVAVVSRDGNGTRIWTSRTLSVNARPRIDEIDVDRSSTYAIGEPIPFAVRAHDPDGGTVDVVWRFGDGTTSSDRAARHAFSEPGSYDVTLTVTDDEGYAVESTVTVTVRNLRPTAEIVRPTGRETYHVGEEIRFEANARDPDGGSVEYRWAFGDDQQAIGQTTPHRYDEPGTYQVVLTVVDDEGGETESRVEVTVRRRGPIETLASLGPSVLVGLGSLLVAVVGLALKLLGGRPSE